MWNLPHLLEHVDLPEGPLHTYIRTYIRRCEVFLTCLSMRTSLRAIFLTILSSSVSRNFLMATSCLVSLCRHFITIPYEPSPIIPRFSYLSILGSCDGHVTAGREYYEGVCTCLVHVIKSCDYRKRILKVVLRVLVNMIGSCDCHVTRKRKMACVTCPYDWIMWHVMWLRKENNELGVYLSTWLIMWLSCDCSKRYIYILLLKSHDLHNIMKVAVTCGQVHCVLVHMIGSCDCHVTVGI